METARLLAISFCAQQPDGDYCTVLSLRSEGQSIARNILDACRGENIFTNCSDSCSRALQVQSAYLECCFGTNFQAAAEVLGNASLVPSEICGVDIPTPCGENATIPPTTIPSECPLESLPCQNYFSAIFPTISRREFLQAQQNVRGLCNPACIALANERPECYGTFEAIIQNNVRFLCSIRPDGELCGVIGLSEEQFRINNASSFECAFGQQPFNCTDSCRNVLQEFVDLQGCCIATSLAAVNLTSVPVYDLCEVSLPLPCESIVTPTPDTPITPVTPTIPTDCPSITAFCQEIFSSANFTETSINTFCNSECFNLTQERPECYYRLRPPQFVAVTGRIFCTERPDGEKCGVVSTTVQATALIMSATRRECAGPAGFNCSHSSCISALQEYVDELGCCAGTIVEEYRTLGLTFLPCSLQVPPPCTGEYNYVIYIIQLNYRY